MVYFLEKLACGKINVRLHISHRIYRFPLQFVQHEDEKSPSCKVIKEMKHGGRRVSYPYATGAAITTLTTAAAKRL